MSSAAAVVEHGLLLLCLVNLRLDDQLFNEVKIYLRKALFASMDQSIPHYLPYRIKATDHIIFSDT